ncbi:TBCC-domain-containing protein [Exidia glandulosa HHB12029]|uniref:TBCC-domain-containing protein n=1 Tax=Exidia glandulosa HHB12029 TaxID=1314781 RepID=A0A165EVN0_EXIGL|nr:TBCC-domain-containing protein [Exidia glandulosa HHB12029]
MSERTTTLIAEFYASFKAEHTSIKEQLNAPKPDFASLQLDVARLRKKLVDATEYLPSYDQRQYNTQLTALETEIQAKQPKARFGFKRKEGASTPTPTRPAPPSAPTPATPTPDAANDNVLKVHDLHDTYVDASTFSIPASRTVELTLSNISSCIVDLRGIAIASVHGKDLRRIVLLLPQIQGSILLDNCAQCLVVVACHQFRMHTTTDTDVYLHIPSMPVVEHCQRVRFTSYPFDLGTVSAAGESQHFAVQDFDWILPGPSPNWSRLDEKERVPTEAWPTARVKDVESMLTKLLPRHQ